MKKIIFSLIIIAVALASFAQVNYKTIKTHSENGTTLIRIGIDEPLIPNADGAYGFRMKAPIPFTSFAIGFDATDRNAPEGHFIVYYRTSQGGKWTNWQDDHGYFRPEDIEPDIFYTDLLFGFDLNMHDSIEFLIFPPVNVQLTKIELVFQDMKSENEEASNRTIHVNATRDGNCLEFPDYVPRSSWCGNYTDCLNPTYSVTYITPTHTIIHHGASPYSYTDGAAVVRSYWYYHVHGLSDPWSDIGYNYLFDKYGNMYQGRHNPNLPTSDVKGAHAGYCNSKSIGLNFIGHSDTLATAPTSAQLEKCWDMLAWWYDNKQLDPTSSADITNQAGQFTFSRYRISGHRDVNQTASGSLGTTCPGETLYAMLPNFRVQVAQKMNECGWNIVLPEDDTVPPTTEITANEWNNSNFNVSFSDRSSTNKAFYQILDKEDGKWTTNTSRGTLYEPFDEQTIPENWTNANGTWTMNSGSIMQSDEELTGTNLHCALHQERGYTYLYHVKMKITGEGSNRRAGFYFFTDNAERQNGYMMFIRPDHNTAQLYKYVNGSYSENGGTYTSLSYTINAGQWYDVKIIFDSNSGKITCYVDDIIAVTLNDSNPFTSGECFSLRSAGCNTEYKDIYVTRMRNSDITANIDENGDIRTESANGSMAGRIRTIMLGNNGMWSDYFEHDVKVDWTDPETEISTDSENTNTDFVVQFDDTDNNFVAERFYNVKSFNGEDWVATNANGFVYNDFGNTIGDEWTSVAGTWSISDGHLIQTETATSNLYASVDQTLADKYMYDFNFKLSDGSTNQRVGLHYMSTDGQTENHGNGYFIYFRLSTSSSRVEFYRVENDTYSQDKCIDLPLNTNVWHNVKLIYDRTNGKSSIYYDYKYYGSYIDENFFTEGNIVAFRNGGATAHIDDFRIYRSRGNTATITVGENGDIPSITPDENDEFATITSITIDSAQNIATYYYSVANDSTIVNIASDNINRITLYPTPNNGSFTVQIDSKLIGKQLTITDLTGKIVFAKEIKDKNTDISLGRISAGIYIARIGENRIKFVVE